MHHLRSIPRRARCVAIILSCLFGSGLLLAFLSAPSPPPSDVSVRAVSASEIALSWNPSLDGFRYMVWRSTNGGTEYLQMGEVAASRSRITWVDHLVQPGSTYMYRISNVPPDYTYYSADSTPVTLTTPRLEDHDIGAAGAAGSSARVADTVLVSGAGADIWGTADAFHFVAQRWHGDGVMVVRVTALDNTAQWAKAGIMFRESLAPGSRYIMAAMNPHGDSALLSRATTDGESQFGISIYTYVPTWLKLVRTGTHFEAFQSRDGSEWITIGSVEVPLGADGFAGLAVTSHQAGTLCRATFDNFNLSPDWNPGAMSGPPLNVQARAVHPGAIEVTWTNPTGRSNFFVETSYDNVSFDPASSTSAGIRDGLMPATTYYFRARALDGGGALYSDTMTVTTPPAPPEEVPAAPTNLTATPGSSSIALRWQDNATNEYWYRVEWSLDGVTWKKNDQLADTTSLVVAPLESGTRYWFRVRAVRIGNFSFGRAEIPSAAATLQTATTGVSPELPPTGGPTITQQPQSRAASEGDSVQFTVAAASTTPVYQWRRDGYDYGTQQTLSVSSVYLGNMGLYCAWVADAGGVSMSKPAILGYISTGKSRFGTEIGANIVHPNGNVYDQVELSGGAPADAITADPGQVTRTSFVDVNGDIVQIEFSGAGTLALQMDRYPTRGMAEKYNQYGTTYWIGRPGIVISGADESTNVGVFSVGRATAVNAGLFREGVQYDGMADIAYIAIMSRNGRFGGVYTGNVRYGAERGHTGIYAPGVAFGSRVVIGELQASDVANGILVVGSTPEARVAGGSFFQANGRPVQVAGLTQLRFESGADSHGRAQPAQHNQARFEQDGHDVTAQIVVESPN